MKPYAVDLRWAIADAESDCNPQGSYDPVELQHARMARANLAIAERLERIAELLERGATVKLLEIGYPDTPATPAATDKIVP